MMTRKIKFKKLYIIPFIIEAWYDLYRYIMLTVNSSSKHVNTMHILMKKPHRELDTPIASVRKC